MALRDRLLDDTLTLIENTPWWRSRCSLHPSLSGITYLACLPIPHIETPDLTLPYTTQVIPAELLYPINTLYKETNVEMKTYVIKLNHPVLVNNSTDKETHYDTVYGFIFSPQGNDREKLFLDEGLISYLGYLSAIHEWSNGTTDFSVSEDQNWITNSGEKHETNDFWSYLIGEECREKIDLRCSIYALDVDVVELLKDKGMDESFVINESLMNKLVYLAKEQNRRERAIFLFNRPIWLPKNVLWGNEEGYTHIYGVISDREYTSLLEYDIRAYAGYLAVCEENYLTGRTPSGYTTSDYITWYKDGIAYSVRDIEIMDESFACKSKYNLKLIGIAAHNLSYTVAMGVRDDLIIDQELYESLIALIEQEESGCPNAGDGCPKTDS